MELNLGFDDKKVALAVSGGADSMVMLYLFIKEYKGEFFVVNVDHSIRGISSVSDSDFVEEYCKQHSVKIKRFKVDALKLAKEKKISLELSARLLRREIFDSLDCDFVATAHHKGDLAETVLYRIARGTGLSGLKGIVRQTGKFIRPLLDFSKQEILDFASKNNIPYVTDETNFSDEADRNFLRLNVLPLLKERFPSFENSVLRLALAAVEADDYLNGVISEPIKTEDGYMIKKPFKHPFLLKKEILLCFKLLGVEHDVEERHLNAIVKLTENVSSKRLDMPYLVTVYLEKDGLVFTKEGYDCDSARSILDGVDFKEGINLFDALEDEKLKDKLSLKVLSADEFKSEFESGKLKGALYCDLDKFPSGTVLRFRRDGDSFEKFGGGTKSLGDFLTDKKFPARLRDKLLVFAAGNDILLIKDIEISEKIKLDFNTKRILVVGGKNV